MILNYYIENLCELYNITNYIINDDGSIDVNGDVNLSEKKLTKIPLIFRNVSGDFNVFHNKLTSLYGSPIYVGGDFICSCNKLTSLEYCPEIIDNNFKCDYNKLITLEYGPKKVGGDYTCCGNKLTSLKYSPEIIYGHFDCQCNNLKTLEYAPKYVYKSFLFYSNKLTSLKYSPIYVGGCYGGSHNKLKSTGGISKRICGDIYLDENNIKTIIELPFNNHDIHLSCNPITKIINKLICYDDNISSEECKDKLFNFIEQEIIQEDTIILNRLKEFIIENNKKIPSNVLLEYLTSNYKVK